jgi:quinone-modifying oxidoreductase subunit QmoB
LIPQCLVERCNIREQWLDPGTQQRAYHFPGGDYLRRPPRIKKVEMPEPYETECDKTSGHRRRHGIKRRLQAANNGCRWSGGERKLGGFAARMYRQTPSSYPYTSPEPVVFKMIQEVQNHPKIK